MSFLIESLEHIAKAIELLQSNPYKDYILPIGSVVVSAAVGIFAVHYSVDKQENNRIQISNIDAINEMLLLACQARANLIALKSNYAQEIDDHPINRILTIPPIFFDNTILKFEMSRLSFLHSNQSTDKISKWINIVHISGVIKNYNFLLNIWGKRNELYEEFILPMISRNHGGTIQHENFIKEIGLGKVAEISDVTELAISLTDDLLIEICCFLEGFSQQSKEKINSKVTTKYRPILKINLPTIVQCEDAVAIISLTPPLNVELVEKILFVSRDEVIHRYRKVYLP